MSAPTKVQTNATATASNVGSVTVNCAGACGQYDTMLVFVKVSTAGDCTGVTEIGRAHV